MSNINKKLFNRLSLNHAYGQLIAMIFVPIAVLACVGASLVLTETYRAAKSQQQQMAIAILTRNEIPAQIALEKFHQLPLGLYQPQTTFMYNMMKEKNLIRTAIVDQKSGTLISIGYQDEAPWPSLPTTNKFFGPIKLQDSSVYGLPIYTSNHQKALFLIELDNQPLLLARYRVMMVLVVTGLLTLLLLLLCLNFYSRRWIAPMYEIRMQLQRLNADTLDQHMVINSTGELRLLQRDIANVVKRLHFSFLELKEHTEQTEDDLRRTLDTLEVQNITYRQARDQAISANQSKSVFLANISHELRTPLNSIDGFIHLLLRQDNLSNEQKLYLQTIRKSSAHLLALINDVLDFSKIDAGKLELETATFNLEEAIYDVMDMLSPLAAQKQLNMAFYFADDVPTHVIGDALRFKQILTNLISNAIKFTPDGEIIVRVRLEHNDIGQCLIHFSVQDSGVGLSGTDRKKLFESFSQGDASVTRQFGGTGLGLAISKQLVHLMHGQIGFEDNQERAPTEKGSTFWFTAQFEIHDDEYIVHPDFSHMHVLSYIAHPATANILRHYLENYQVDHLESVSILDLFSRLNHLPDHQDTWLIVDHSGDTQALLQEIRSRYHGKMAVYGYQMSLAPDMLLHYKARPLYQPLCRTALIELLNNEHPFKESNTEEFDGKGLHILAVDDHLPNLIVLEALLGELNVTTTKALSGKEALDIFQAKIKNDEQIFDLIFMDIQMPVMSGIDTTRAIRSLESTLENHQPVPIIALTAHALADEKQKLLKVGMNDYVTKPIQIEQIIQILTRWTHKNFSQNNHYVEKVTVIKALDPQILNWQQCLQLAANKEDLAIDLLKMLTDSFYIELNEIEQLIELEDFPQVEHVLHRLHGATRYVGVPRLQETTSAFEQFVAILRKERKKADEAFIQETLQRLDELKQVMAEVEHAAKHLLDHYSSN
ncbi:MULTISPECIES: ATP-binding protein [unclassified Acinetobacter]|uniref:GacS-like sensor histidine kinase n=1 Tax=unclassified Acinetobacter TaxID=196816 RepID=UPI00293528D6|nr:MULTISPECIES: ATP-binding protein [unclassified Acinetobacter]WOE31242.1 ATP-binding protein [Acinetobacter sp. SAAs470]WOE39438.1 ATP-binding protein [Acinetobacter sp. SAAs474]